VAKKKSKKKLIIFSIIGVIALVLILLVVLGGKKEVIVNVQTEKIQKRTITQIVTASGKIQPVISVTINPEVSGEIVNLPVVEGQPVKKGEVLVKIKPDAYIAQLDRQTASLNYSKSQLEVQKANLDKAQQDYKRQEELFKKNLISESDFESVKAAYSAQKAQYESAKHSIGVSQANLNETKTSLEKTTIISPMEGIISQLNSRLGERVFGTGFSSGTAIMTVADLSAMEARVEVGENDVVLIKIGDTARVEIDAFPNRKFNGVVYEIANTAKSTGMGTQEEIVNFEVKIKILDKDVVLRPGMSCTADIETNTKTDVWAVPIQSVTTRTMEKKMGENMPPQDGPPQTNVTSSKDQQAKKEYTKPQEVVFVIENNIAKMLKVKTGISDDKYIEVIEGLKGNEDVVSGSYRAINRELEDNKPVKVEQQGFKKSDQPEKK
jgi:HlyD family secretion protein